MAGKNLKVNLIANTSQFKSAMAETSNQMKLINSEFKSAAAETDEYGNKLDSTGAKKKQLTGVISQYQTRIKAITNEQKHWTSELEKGNITEEQHAQKQQELARRLNNTEGEMKRYEGQLKRLNSEGKATKKTYEEIDKQFRDVGRTMATTGAAVGAVTGGMFAAIVKPMKDAVEVTKDFDKEMSKVQALTGATTGEFKAMRDMAKDLGATTSFSASEAASAISFLGMAGFETNEILDATPGLLNLAASAGMDLGRAADIASNIISGFNMEANQAGRVSDVLARASSNANTNVEQMGDSMATVAPIASTLGMSLEDMASGTMIMSDAGLQGSQAGRMLRQGLIRLAKPTGEAEKLIKKLGVNVFDADGNMKSLDKVVAELDKGLDGMSSQAQTAALATMFGSESTAGWSALLSSGSKTIKEYTTDLKNSEGAAADMAKTMKDNLTGSIDELESGIEGLQIRLGESLMPTIRGATDWLTNLVGKIDEMDDSTVQAIAQTALFAAGVLGVTTAVAGTVAAIGALMAVAGPLGLAIVGGTALLGGLGLGIYGVKQHTEALQEAQREAKQDALNYGANLSEGTQTGVKAYTDLFEHAKIKMVELRTMSGDEAKKTKEELRKAFSDMADVVIAELEVQRDELTRVINEIYGTVGEAGQATAEMVTDQVLELFDKDIAEYKRARDTINGIIDEYGANWHDYPKEVQQAYNEAYEVMDKGAAVFAESQREMQAIQQRIVDQGGAIQNHQVQEFLNNINSTYDGSLKAIQEHYVERVKILDQGLAQEKISQEEHERLMKGLASQTTGMLRDASKQQNDALQELAGHVDKRGELIDLETGKILERAEVEEMVFSGHGGRLKKREETDEEYFNRWLKMQEDYLTNTQKFADESNRVANEQQIELLESIGFTYDEALILMADLNKDTTEALSSGAEESMEAGKVKGEHYIMGLGESVPEAKRTAKEIIDSHNVELEKSQVEIESLGKASGQHYIMGLYGQRVSLNTAAKKFSDAGNEGLGTGDDVAESHGKSKGQSHKTGLESTINANNITARDLTNQLINQLEKGGTESKNAGKSKGDAHQTGLKSTEGANKTTALGVTRTVTDILKTTNDGGGGKKAGNDLRSGLIGTRGVVYSAGRTVATEGRKGLASVDTSKTGSDFVSGFRGSINSGSGSVWGAAWSLGKSALGALKNSIRSASPSKLTGEEGTNFIDGFTLAIDKGKKDSVRSASLVGKESLEALKNETESFKQSFGAVSLAIQKDKQVFKVEHEINNSKLENKISSLENVLEKLITVMVKDKETSEQKEQPFVMNVTVRNDEDINKIDNMLSNRANRKQAAWGGGNN